MDFIAGDSLIALLGWGVSGLLAILLVASVVGNVWLLRRRARIETLASTLRGKPTRCEWLAEAVDDSPMQVFVQDEEGRYVYANPAWAKTYQREAVSLAGKTDNELFDEIHSGGTAVALLEGTPDTACQLSTSRSNEETRRVIITFPVDDGAGRPLIGHMIVEHDTPGVSVGERACARLLGMPAPLFERLPQALLLLDADLRAVDGNPALERVLGEARGQVLGRGVGQIGSLAAVHGFLTGLFRSALAGQSESSGCVRCPRDDGTSRAEEWHCVPLTDRDGRPVGVLAIVSDISEHRRATRRAVQGERHLQELLKPCPETDVAVQEAPEGSSVTNLLGAVPEVLLAVSPAGKLTHLGPAFERLTGWRAADWLGRSPRPLVYPADRPRVRQLVGDLRRNRESAPQEVRLCRPDGGTVRVECVGMPATSGRPVVGLLGLARDDGPRLELETQLRQIQKVELLGQLAAGVIHDLNNILTVITGYVALLNLTPRLEDSERELLHEIGRAVERGSRLTRQLLAFGRRRRPNPIALDLNAVVCDVGRMLRRLLGERIELEVLCSSEPLGCRIDAGSLEQVLVNLIVNARDAMPEGGRLWITTCFRDRRYGRISVRDSGCGMSEEVRERVFEPFFTTKEVGRGTGLGLSTARRIIAEAAGELTMESRPGQGTVFHIDLPLHVGPLDAPALLPAEMPRGTETVLVVEDEFAVRRMLVELLEAHGYQALEAENGFAALRQVEAGDSPVDLVLTDVALPDLDGPSLGARLAARPSPPPVLYFSGHGAERFGATPFVPERFLAKPLYPPDLLLRIRQTLARESSADRR